MLSCDFDVESDQLLSLKWYKDGHEFFRYFMHPGARMQTFPVDGVHVDVSYSFVLLFVALRPFRKFQKPKQIAMQNIIVS